MNYTLRPLTQRPSPKTRKRSPFSASWSDTLEVLAREVKALEGSDVVIEVDVTEDQLRLDGQLRAGVSPASPAVAVSFTTRRDGPLLMRCDAFYAGRAGRVDDWQHNVRAIAMTLESLRAVERYGAAASGEQYTGWRQIGAGRAIVTDAPMTREAAADVLMAAMGGSELDDEAPFISSHTLLREPLDDALMRRVARVAQRRTHPDTGGSADLFDRVQRAIAVLRPSTGGESR